MPVTRQFMIASRAELISTRKQVASWALYSALHKPGLNYTIFLYIWMKEFICYPHVHRNLLPLLLCVCIISKRFKGIPCIVVPNKVD